MGKFDKQLKYSIRKVSVGAASVVIGAFYLAMGAGVVHAADGGASHSSSSSEYNTNNPNGLSGSNYQAKPAPNPSPLLAGVNHSVNEKPETKTVTRTIKYVNASDESKEVSTTVTQKVTLTRTQGTEEWTTGKWEKQPSPTVNGYGDPDKSTIESKEVTSTTEDETIMVYYTKLDASSTSSTRGRRVRREAGDAPAGGTSNTPTGTETPAGSSTGNNEALDSALIERKGATVQPNQPGISIPTGDEHGAHDPNAHISFVDPDHDATVEEMWKIIQHMPDDFQNNERSYLRNMDTLGRELRFDKTAENPEGVPLQPGEIRELHDFGGWHAIDENGNKGKFAIGRKNAQGYFTGWHKVGQTENGIPIIEQGGMLGADVLDNIYVHEQALDRRFDYMLMLVKGRTRANRNDTVADNSTYDPHAPSERAKMNETAFNKLPFLERDKYNKYSPAVVGYNGIEKKFTAFSTKYGSRVRVDFVTGYISDINGSKGSYRIVIKTQNSKGEETKVYDETISRVAEIVQNEELYKKGLNIESAHANILKFLKDEFNYRVNKIKNPKVRANPLLRGTKEKDYTTEQQKVYDQIVEEATEEVKKQGDIVMNVTEDFLSIAKSGKRDSEWKKTFTNTNQSTPKLSNDLNTLLKNVITPGEPNSPTWAKTSEAAYKADDKAYKLLTALIPGAKKITYHVNDDQLEVETDKYTYTAARNGSKEVGIQGSNIAATDSAASYGFTSDQFATINSNTTVNNNNGGWARASDEEYGKFSHLIGKDHGINRTNVLTDKALSDKIIEKLGPGNEKLGRAGYFSTADIPLGTDVVSYTVQVIPSDNERVGVNSQSSRIQYNMPILADFSVIQDTSGPSKEVAIRIIRKSNLPEDKKNKIIEEIKKSKKTSEIRSAMSGNVKVRYVDKAGNVITNIENEKTFGEKDSENRYTAAKDVLINSTYDVTARAYRTLSTTNNKYYSLVADNGGLASGSAATTGTIDTTGEDKVVTFVYELTEKPVTPTTGKGVVHFKKQVSGTVTEPLTGYGDITLSGNVGETFSSTEVDTKITELKNAGYEIVTNEFDTNSKTIDSTTDEDGQDPSQVYNVIVREKVETVTTPPTPDTPVDPNIPDGPKWPESGLKESDLTKEVTRTITYVKKETADGEKIPDAQPTKVDKVLYKRTATYNLVSKTVTYSNWTPTADATHTATRFSPVKTPVLIGYVADIKEVTKEPPAPDENGEVMNMTKEVVYTKIGSWIPKIPGKTPTPILYPNDPEDATKPKYPDYPTTPENPNGTPNPQPDNPGGETPGTPEKPKTPVIPYVEGYVPKIPTDPTTPVGEDNPLKPLVPIDSNDPKKGYKVPELPNDPKKDTVIEYKPNPQKILIKVVNVTTGEEVELPNEKLEFNGVSDQVVTSEDKGKVDKKIDSLQKRGYIVSTKNPITETTKYDTKDDSSQKEPTQTYKIIVNEPVTKDTEVRKVTRTIKYVKIDVQDGNEVRTELNTEKIKTKVDKVEFSRDTTTSLATGLTKIGAWDQETKELPKVNTPVLVGYIANVVSVENKSVSPDTESYEVTVEYRKIGSWVPNLPEGVTPPTGTDMTPKPYPNNPTDPTKPGTPVYPEPGQPITPGTPVIPYVPGYTPKIGETPLQPVDPNNPGKGYKVPPVPTEPGTNTDITYVADPQKAVVKVFNTTTGTEVELPAEKVSIDNGTTDAAIPTDSVTAKIADLEKRGYVVENKDLLNNQKFDNEKDPTDGDPTQVFKLKVHEKVVTVTEPKNPNDPVDPDKPEGPKWPTEGLAKSDLEKEVTRTITYVKKETADGPEIADAKPTKKQTAHFKRSATYNLVTKVVTPGEWTSTDKTLEAVPTEKLDGYVANVSSVEEVETNVNSTNLDRKVVYTKLGSWVLTPPTGVTPPEGTNFDPKPYPNHPTDPTKPGDPTDPNVPVIPYVPGYTPKIGETPLQPKVPNDPTQGYIPPAVPTEPGTNTDITYVADPQKAVVKVFNTTTGTEVELPAEKVSIDNGTTDSAIPTDSVTAKIADLEKRGYVVENKDLLNNQKFDNQKDSETGDPTQVFNLKVHEKVVEVTEPPTPNTPVDPNVPVEPNKPVDPTVPKWPAEGLKESDLKKEVTRTITYVKKETPNGEEVASGKDPVTQTAHFTRKASYNVVTGAITYGNWESTDKELAKVDTPTLTGYVADKASVDKVETNADSTGLDQKVVYTKLGSWVPRLPEGVKPPTGTDMTPKPYPNHPTDPTTPGTPVYPEPGQPITPGTPVIPYVPGYTPKIGETPLQPVDPEHPENGYKVPPVPTTPGTNTDITYVADPQKAVVKVFNTTTGKEVELPAEKVSIDNGTTDSAIPTDSVTAKIADLEKRGYVVENKDLLNNQKFDNQKDSETGDPTQVFNLKVHEKVVEVTEPPTPNTPVDPNVPVEPNKPVDPTVPKWPAEGLKESDLKKEVTRTITYVKKETPNGEEVASGKDPVTQTAHFTRKASYNVVTGAITYGNWESTDKELAKVDTPTLTGYVADKASVDKVETNADSTGLDQKVVYTKLGSWVPRLPEGVKPPTGTDMTPKPYPNHPTDPTTPGTPVYPEPGQPTDPNTPKPPVIPYVPGYTPVLPKDPTKPVSPENPLEPLTPVDPKHPENGYKVPPVPTKPGQDTPIEYVKEGKQRAITNFVDGSNNNTPIAPPVVDEGDSNKAFTKDGDVAKKIAELKAKGYDIVENNYPPKGTFDNDPKVDQYYTVKVTPHVEPVKPFDPTQPGNPDNPKPEPNQPIDPKNPNGPKWTNELINKLETKKVVTRTIQYVDEDGNRLTYTKDGKNTTLPVIDTVTFTREAKINVVTGEVTYSEWKAVDRDTTFDKVTSPIVPGYILKDSTQKEVAEKTGVSETTKDEIIQVVYKKLGSWIPKLPEGVTPPEGTDMTPKPYPNDPTDPTKPGTDKPKVPTIPGYTPMIPTDPTKPVDPNTNPLKPLDPSPNGGYEVPNIPTDPSKDIPITYVKEGDQKVIINFVDKDGKSLAAPIIATGESGKKFSTDNLVNATISKLEKEGYKKTGGNYPEENDRIFDKDSKVDQVYNIVFNPNSEKPQNENGKPDPKPDSETPETPKQKAIIKFVVVGEDGKEREIESYKISATGKSGDTIPTNVFDETLKKLTGDPTTNGDYELVGENPLKDKPTFDKTKDEEGKDPSQVFTVKLRQINVLPPTPRIVERRDGNNTVEVGVPNKDADTLFIKYTEKGKSSTDPQKEIITKKNENGDWVVEKKPEGVEITVNPKTGVVSIPSKEIQPKTNVDTQTKHKYKLSKIVSVMPNIFDVKEFKGITVWVDESGKELKPQEGGIHKKENIKGYESKFVGYEWEKSVLEGNKVTHIFKKVSTPTPYTPRELTPENPTPQPNPEHPNVPTPSPELPNQETPIPEPDTPSPETPVNPDPEVPTYETGKREELPNTGTESNATLAGAGIMTLLAGLGLGFFKKKEKDDK